MISSIHTARELAPAQAPVEPEQAPVCKCGATLAPDGACLEIGACPRADRRATRHATGRTSKYAVPSAWNARGSVD